MDIINEKNKEIEQIKDDIESKTELIAKTKREIIEYKEFVEAQESSLVYENDYEQLDEL